MKEILAQWKLIVAVLGLLAAIGWWTERDGRLRAEGRAEVAVERADSLEGAVVLAQAVAESAAADAIRVREQADTMNARNERLISNLRTSRPQVVERVVREAGPDSTVVREAVAEVAETYEAEINVLRASLVQRDAVIEAQDARILALEAENGAQASLIAALQDVNRARVDAGPGFFDSTPVKIVTHVVVAYAGYEMGRRR